LKKKFPRKFSYEDAGEEENEGENNDNTPRTKNKIVGHVHDLLGKHVVGRVELPQE
jgi:hypothetical protein